MWTFAWFSEVLAAVLGLLLAIFGVGCAPKATELERFSDRVLTEIIAPVAQKAMAETTTRTATLQGGVQGIEPGYQITFDGFFGTGVHAQTEIRVIGVAGQLTGHSQADQGQAATVPPPAIREAESQPVP